MKRHSGQIEVRPAIQYINSLRSAWRAAFASACRHDGIEEGARFAVFSEGNPFRQFVDRAASEYFEACAVYQSGGYVGLRMEGGRCR